MSRASVRRIVASVGAAGLLACATGCLAQSRLDELPPGWKPPVEKLVVLREKDSATGVLVREWTVLSVARERDVKHGRESTWYPSGAKEWEREFDRGAPKGTWRRWHENGTLASETIFAGSDVATTQRFWHRNGELASSGPAKDGVRCGEWRVFREDGTLAEQGAFVDARREGPWTSFAREGVTSVVVYAKGVRVADHGFANGSAR